ncbi:sensor histidine kinase [Desnuesiella massiliensis]|uniref:sensor histidine kinase n=1 Tax=Desnuesiella massiliensis TaxID=1650662 RepID=UPI0006E1B14C|nr:ATP-binding protein [Desnuesiella massiliensis]
MKNKTDLKIINKSKKQKKPQKQPGLIRRLFRTIFKPLLSFMDPMLRFLDFVKEKVKESIRFELIITFGVCFFFAVMVFGISSNYFSRDQKVPQIDYSNGVSDINRITDSLLRELSNGEIESTNKEAIDKLLQRYGVYNSELKLIITDLEGKIIYKTSSVAETQIDIYNLIKNASNFKATDWYDNYQGRSDVRKEIVIFYPLKLKDIRTYLIVKDIPEPNIVYTNYRSRNDFLALVIAVAAFIAGFIFVTNKKMRYIEEISEGVAEIAKGKLDYRIKNKGKDELNELAWNINHMAEEIENKIENERRAEKTKNELVTNVSHDLRTPLTSVMGYIGLVKEGKYETEEQMQDYLNIAFNKAEKLKVLIEDLFEYTKLSNEGVKLYKAQVNLKEFIEQLIDEMIPICEENSLNIIKELTEERIYVSVDPGKMLRVLENLLTNAIKYSYKPGNIKVFLEKEHNKAVICVENKGDNISSEKIHKLFERFYRLDEARNTSSGGSGLGLAIAKNIVELHGGSIWAECIENDIRFYVSLNIEA